MSNEAITIPEIAKRMNLAEQTIRNNYIAEIKLNCRHRMRGKRLEINREDFEVYDANSWKKPSRAS